MVFIDETWAKTNMTRTHGWCTKGEALIDKVPHGHWKTLTFIAGLRHDGIVAPCVLDGPINGESFTAWVEQFLIPVLEPGSIVVVEQPRQPQGTGGAQDAQGGGHQAVLPAALLARSEPHRRDVLQAQTPPAQGK
jgi:hypothetical protein